MSGYSCFRFIRCILFGRVAGIGFLVAAKLILHFGEARGDRAFAEYVLIGTFLSYGMAIATGMLLKVLLASF